MLEHQSLWLSATSAIWPPGINPSGRLLRRVLNAASHEPVGYVAITPGRWWPWPARLRIAAYEGPDGSLLFTAVRGGWFWPVTAVADADGNVVAIVYGPTVGSPARRFIARRGTAGTYVGPDRAELVRWTIEGGGIVIQFAESARGEPFLKMGLLAAILIEDTSTKPR